MWFLEVAKNHLKKKERKKKTIRSCVSVSRRRN